MTSKRDLFYIDPSIVFLNHGSFGATPKEVIQAQRSWQERLEQQPVQFMNRKLRDHFELARFELASYLNTSSDRIVYIPNVTYGVNLLARSLALGRGDEILSTNHEYGACDHTWQFISEKTGARYVRQSLALPLEATNALLAKLWQRVTAKTKVIFISHISSPTATVFPVREICDRARESGILTMVDGAHAPGQIPVDLSEIDADFYVGNCHKWMMGPKGSGFLYCRPEQAHIVQPLVVSWGWPHDYEFTTGIKFLDYLQWPGTVDPTAYLSVPAAIAFQDAHDWSSVRRQCHALLAETLEKLTSLTGLPSCYRTDREFHQMAIVRLPPIQDLRAFQTRLYDDYRIEVPIIEWKGEPYVRISVQGYNTKSDLDTLMGALSSSFTKYTVK